MAQSHVIGFWRSQIVISILKRRSTRDLVPDCGSEEGIEFVDGWSVRCGKLLNALRQTRKLRFEKLIKDWDTRSLVQFAIIPFPLDQIVDRFAKRA